FAAGGIATGSLRGALVGAFTGAAFQQIGQHFNTKGIFNKTGNRYGYTLSGDKLHTFGGNLLTSGQITQQIASHAVVGGVAAELAGGKFGHGFFSAGVTKGLGGAFLPSGSNLSTGEIVEGTVVSAVIGGTASEISGGKFGNGAGTAAFQFLFNQASNSSQDELKEKYRTVFRALTPEQRASFDNGLGIFARNRAGTLSPELHIGGGSEFAGGSPWISTSTQLLVVNGGYSVSNSGVVMIDLTKVPGEVVTFNTIGEAWYNAPDVYFKLAYIRSVWAQEVLIKGHVPQEAMQLIDRGDK
ncbi:hypothetical protein, partial [Alteromonas mediterranea]|uniref:hypothetical protein n=1 Tax=Alteromonas mediterranea TaxID=314275 RepID=UPI002FE03F14